MTKSWTNFFDFSSGDVQDNSRTPRALPKVITAPGVVSNLEDDVNNDGSSNVHLTVSPGRTIIVANSLPLHAQRDTNKWCFSLDEDSLLLQMKDGLFLGTEVTYVGSLNVDIDSSEQEEKFYNGFCKQQLWPLFHYMLPISPDRDDRFNRSLWQAYLSANKIFADKIMEVINPDDDYVWVHDYHLMVLPSFLRKRFSRVKLGFFFHSPFPSSEIYRTLPVREDILKSLLNSDLIGFHTFDYAWHFLSFSCCSRMLGLDYASKWGYIGLEYFGRTVNIKILPVGVHMGRLESVLNLSSTANKLKEIREQFAGKMLILGVDDMDIFKGISLRLLAVEKLLQEHPELQGILVIVQIANSARSTGKDVEEAKRETQLIAKRINEICGSSGYNPVFLIENPISLYEKVAYYSVAECCVVNAVRDGMNLVPYKYIVCRQGTAEMDEAMTTSVKDSSRTSTLIVSEFIGCSPSLSGTIRVNPWDIDAVADALYLGITMPDAEKQLRHEKHYRYVSSHNVAYWVRSFVQDLERACKDHFNKRCWRVGLGLGFRVVAVSPNFRKLSTDHIVPAYKRTSRRAIFLDYDGTIMPQTSIVKTPGPEIITVVNNLCNDIKNTVFIISGRGRHSLSEWFAPCEMLGIAAEHGYFTRSQLENDCRACDEITETTDGSYIETKESALVCHHQDADPDFGSCQSMELLDHLEKVLANEPVVVKRGQYIVEVKPQESSSILFYDMQGVSKGLVAEKLLTTMVDSGKPPDFVICIGDDRSDEDMFESISNTVSIPSLPKVPEIFACTVGQKPSKAKYYLDDSVEVIKMLQKLAAALGTKKPRHVSDIQVCFERLGLDS
ncbi:hypothetical protein GIB67_016521 [Kingdonia uniflora]|uniref:Uncharacterized protein n=1 Tax=Kingdonia uniflora TaxID=39325 RepID=A0A7J7NQ79_9MAGN|nr:hypothetical protein GIB67_016521 [Kingdonia uniflora]